MNSVCFYLNCNRMHKHAKCGLIFTFYVIFDVFFEMLIYVTKHIYVIMCILVCYSMLFMKIFVAFTLLIFSVYLHFKLSMIYVCKLFLHI